MGIASGKNNSVVTLHTLLSDMPSADNEDHDGRYYTETEVNTILGDYFLEDGQSDNIVNGTFDLTTTGKLGATVLENTAGDLAIEPTNVGDVDVFTAGNEKSLKVYFRTSIIDIGGSADSFPSIAIGSSAYQLYVDNAMIFRGDHGRKPFKVDGSGFNLGMTYRTNTPYFKHQGYITSLGAGKYVNHYLDRDGYYKTTPEDANVLGWNIGMDVAIDGDITADNLGTASAEDVGYFEPAKGTDDNFVTDYQLSILSTLVSHTWVNS